MQPTDFPTSAGAQASDRSLGSARRRWLAGTSLPLVAAVAGILAIAAWPRQEAPTSVDLTALVASQSAEPTTVTAADEDFAQSAEKGGLPYPQLIERITRLGLKTARD